MINKIIPDFEPPNINSFSSDAYLNLSNNNDECSKTEQNHSLSLISGFQSFINEDNNKIQTKENISQSFENNYFCTICHKEKAINLCYESNHLI